MSLIARYWPVISTIAVVAMGTGMLMQRVESAENRIEQVDRDLNRQLQEIRSVLGKAQMDVSRICVQIHDKPDECFVSR